MNGVDNQQQTGEARIWVFNSLRPVKPYSFSSAVFTSVEIADSWVAFHGCSGVLSEYPVDTGFFDWARQHGVEGAQLDNPSPETIEDWADLPLIRHHYKDCHREGGGSMTEWLEDLERAPLRLDESNAIWLFVGTGEGKPLKRFLFPSAAFRRLADAERWIRGNRCAGTLTQYPLDEGAYDWAVRNGVFKPKQPKHFETPFIETFSSASQPHEHYARDERH